MSETDLQFYARRLAEEKSRATYSKSPEAASAHRVLAELYAVEVKRFSQPHSEKQKAASVEWASDKEKAKSEGG